MEPCEDGFDVVWTVPCLCRGWVEIETSDDPQPRVFAHDGYGFIPQGTEYIRVPVSGLPPGTELRFRTVTESMADPSDSWTSDWRNLHTLDPAKTHTRFAVWSDTHSQDETIRKLDEITPRNLDFLAWNGDICNDWHEEDALAPTLLHPAGTDFTRGRPMLFNPGNHDVRGAWGFRLPQLVFRPGAKPYRAVRSGPAAVLFLNTGEDKPDNHPTFNGRVTFQTLREEQAQWLQQVIREPAIRDAPYRIVCCHLPLRWIVETKEYDYDRYSERSRVLWHESLVKWGAQLILSGHTHQFTYLPPDEKSPYAQVIGGGPNPETSTLLQAEADKKAFRLTALDLRKNIILQEQFPPLSH